MLMVLLSDNLIHPTPRQGTVTNRHRNSPHNLPDTFHTPQGDDVLSFRSKGSKPEDAPQKKTPGSADCGQLNRGILFYLFTCQDTSDAGGLFPAVRADSGNPLGP